MLSMLSRKRRGRNTYRVWYDLFDSPRIEWLDINNVIDKVEGDAVTSIRSTLLYTV